MITPNVPVWGNETGDYFVNGVDQTNGTLGWFGENGDQPLTTPWEGPLVVNYAMAPAFWDVYWLEPWPCGNNTNPQSAPVDQGVVFYEGADWWEEEIETAQLNAPNQTPVPNYYSTGQGLVLLCYTTGALLPASTRFAILGNLPSSLTLGSAVPLATQNGMPLLYVYDKTGTVVTTLTATNVSSDGTQATFPFPSSLIQAGYSLALVNQTGGGIGFAPAGDNLLSIASSQTISGNPFGVAVGGQTVTLNICINGVVGGRPVQHCGSSSHYNTIPVVSLYSQGQVLIGSTPVNVGSNPTAVAVYPAASQITRQTTGNSQIMTTISGSMRAVVANSGSNTISILDIANNVLLSNVTVGNEPVALVVSSDGSTAYVANYADSTVTQVNLTSGTAGATVAVGGQPTSVALTAAGTLWVGGVGFLSEINSQNMSLVATQSTVGKTIAALGFSDAENELVVTSTDTSGNVNVDEVNPSTVQPGSLYTTVASHTVSTLGTYLNPQTQTQVQAFTATMATSPTPINSNLPGAPPLVVQDGWAVVTATPTGFTITDLSGHDVLVSETTPSPIAAIAVDSKLNVVYLTMPDSNTLLTVPLPGTN
jgi:YVTN family beta-propeller protein